MWLLIYGLYIGCVCLPVLVYAIRRERASWKRYNEHWDEVSGRKRRQ